MDKEQTRITAKHFMNDNDKHFKVHFVDGDNIGVYVDWLICSTINYKDFKRVTWKIIEQQALDYNMEIHIRWYTHNC